MGFLCVFGVGTNVGHFAGLFRRGPPLRTLFSIPFADKTVNFAELVGYCVGGCMAVGFIWTKNWVVNNMFGVSFCLAGSSRSSGLTRSRRRGSSPLQTRSRTE